MSIRYTVDLQWDKIVPKDFKDSMKRRKVCFQTCVKLDKPYSKAHMQVFYTVERDRCYSDFVLY